MSKQEQKTIFITGSSSGLGRATAKLFASRGWKVIASMRNPDNEKELGRIPGISLVSLDITDPREIDQVAQDVVASGSIDVVFNNAGHGLTGALEALTDEQILRVVETNMLGAIRTTKAFIPHFRQKRAGLFINTTSIGGLMTVPFNSLYHATKWALEGWSESMAFELNQLGIGIKTIEPGGMKTDFFTRSLDTARHPAYDELVNRVMGIITDPKQMATYSSPEQIAEIVFEAATDGKDQLRYIAGSDAKAMNEMRLQIGDEAFRKAMVQQFFGDTPQAASTPR
jgi:NAD(P)-dependent dehydrogenase (short-subunit alcohol dehydrogenase family)